MLPVMTYSPRHAGHVGVTASDYWAARLQVFPEAELLHEPRPVRARRDHEGVGLHGQHERDQRVVARLAVVPRLVRHAVAAVQDFVGGHRLFIHNNVPVLWSRLPERRDGLGVLRRQEDVQGLAAIPRHVPHRLDVFVDRPQRHLAALVAPAHVHAHDAPCASREGAVGRRLHCIRVDRRIHVRHQVLRRRGAPQPLVDAPALRPGLARPRHQMLRAVLVPRQIK